MMDALIRERFGPIPVWEVDEKPGPVGHRRWPRPRPLTGDEVRQHRIVFAGTADLSVLAGGQTEEGGVRAKKCETCGKTTWRTYGSAHKAAVRLPVPGRVYWCQPAGGYHVTHLDAAEYARRRAGDVA